jgi:diamine N-acetyltransferase
MVETITIRSCSLHDANTIVSLGIRTFRDTFDDVNKPEDMMMYINDKFTLRKIREEIEEPGSLFLLAEKNGKAVGYARVRTSNPPAEFNGVSALEIERLYADKHFIGHGVGKALMSKCLDYAKQHSFEIVWLGVWEHNERAIEFYKKNGFEKFSHHVFMLGRDAQIDHLMKKNLN